MVLRLYGKIIHELFARGLSSRTGAKPYNNLYLYIFNLNKEYITAKIGFPPICGDNPRAIAS